MKFAILPCRPARIGLMISICIMLGLLAANLAAAQGETAAAQGEGFTKLTVPLGDNDNTYAELATVLPSVVSSEAYDHKILNYTGGRDIRTDILLDGSLVTIFLLYPCEPPRRILDAEGMKSLLAAADNNIVQANYTESFLNISGKPTIGGQLGPSIFAAYQPTNQTAALIVMADSLNLEIMAHLLYNMSITVDEKMTPIPPGYCSDASATSNETAAISTNATESAGTYVNDVATEAENADNTAAEDASSSTVAAESSTVTAESSSDNVEAATPAVAQTETGSDSTQSRKDKAEADRKAAMAKLEEARANMKR